MKILKEMLMDIQAALADGVEELKYIDKDWGQLNYEVPAVKYPCALLDIANVQYGDLLQGSQIATVEIAVLVANQRLIPGSSRSPRKGDSYQMIDLLEKIHQKLQLYGSEKYSPLLRAGLVKVETDSGEEIYQLTYRTQCVCHLDREIRKAKVEPSVKVRLAR